MKKIGILVSIMLILVVSYMLFHAGHFLFQKKAEAPKGKVSVMHEETKKIEDNTPSIRHKSFSLEISGLKQQINMLEVNLKKGDAMIKPVLSYDSVFGFEKLSSMYSRSGACAAINAGFFYEYGQPGGMVAIDGKLVSKSTGRYPVFIVSGSKACISEVKTSITIYANNKIIDISNINSMGSHGETHLYSSYFGPDNRAKTANLSVGIVGNEVTFIGEYPGKCEIPEGGMLLSFFKPSIYDLKSLPLKKGDKVNINYSPALESDCQAYECGSWLVKAGKVVIGESDEWVGLLTNRDPRTAVGVREDGIVIFIAVDGRQPGYSMGLTGQELGNLLLKYGAVNAAMLDGGASTEMIVDGRIMNKPSFKGQERLLGGALIVKKRP